MQSPPEQSASLDMGLPPYARRLDVRATRAAFAAGTLGTVGDDTAGENAQRNVEARNPHRDDANDVQHRGILTDPTRPATWTEADRLAFLRRAQRIDPRERSGA
jgi:hypothetical protein